MSSDCGKCDDPILSNQFKVICSTCQLSFHLECAKVSQRKYEVLSDKNSDIFWFCQSCKLTTANMLNHLSDVIQRVSAMEAERKKEKKELATLQNLVKCFNERVKKIEDGMENNSTDIEVTKNMVREMLSSIPQVSSIDDRFSEIEDRIEECVQQTREPSSSVSSIEIRLSKIESDFDQIKPQIDAEIDFSNTSHTTVSNCSFSRFPDNTTLAEVSNELQERNKRARSLVIHNLPETSSDEQELSKVSNLLQEVLPGCKDIEFEQNLLNQKPRIYRLGQSRNRVRSLKVHLKSVEIKEEILANARRLANSVNHREVVIQKDMTPLERIQLKRLVHEKRRRNHAARASQQEANWTIRGGILCRKTDC